MPKPKLKTYQVTQVIYVTMSVKAVSPDQVKGKVLNIINNYDTCPDNEPHYQKALAQSEYELKEIIEIDA